MSFLSPKPTHATDDGSRASPRSSAPTSSSQLRRRPRHDERHGRCGVTPTPEGDRRVPAEGSPPPAITYGVSWSVAPRAVDLQDWGGDSCRQTGRPSTSTSTTSSSHSRDLERVRFRGCARAMLATRGRRSIGQCRHARRLSRVALANTSDGLGHSYGAHLNVLVTRAAWDNICVRKPHYLAWLAAFQASSIVYTGAGKAGSENGRSRRVPVESARRLRRDADRSTDHLRRPIVNTRDEPLCGPRSWRPRDTDGACRGCTSSSTTTHWPRSRRSSRWARCRSWRPCSRLARSTWAWRSTIRCGAFCMEPGSDAGARARTIGGGCVTAVELQLQFLDEAKRFADAGGLDVVVPRAAEILALWRTRS